MCVISYRLECCDEESLPICLLVWESSWQDYVATKLEIPGQEVCIVSSWMCSVSGWVVMLWCCCCCCWVIVLPLWIYKAASAGGINLEEEHAGLFEDMVWSVDVGRELKHGGSASVLKVFIVELEAGIVSHESKMLMTWLGRSIFLLLLFCLYGNINSLKVICHETKNFLLVRWKHLYPLCWLL